MHPLRTLTRTALRATALGAALAVATACVSTPVTGRMAFNLFSEAEDCELGNEAYAQILADEPIITTNWGSDGQWKQTVEEVMQRLAAVSHKPDFAYEVKLIADPQTVNAFCLPCGKMAVYQGILPVCQDATGLAVVMGHEIGHAVARHGTERLSQDALVQAALAQVGETGYAEIGGVLAQMTLSLPHGRKQELEADEIGLMYMARAGYDPREAVRFWERMEALGGGSTPEWLSTHPSHSTRAERLTELLPEALKAYEAATKP